MKIKFIVLSFVSSFLLFSAVYASNYDPRFDKSVLNFKKEDIKKSSSIPTLDVSKKAVSVSAVVPAVVTPVVSAVVTPVDKVKFKDTLGNSSIKKYYDSEFDNVCYVLGNDVSCVSNH